MLSFVMGSWLQKWRFCRNPSPPKRWRSKFAKCWTARPETELASPLEESRLVGMLERETGFEPATLALARRCSTTELFPPRSQKNQNYTGSTREASRRGDRELGSDHLLDRRNVTLRQVLGDERIDRKREELTGNRKDEHAWRGAIGWRRAGLTQGNREPGSVGMP